MTSTNHICWIKKACIALRFLFFVTIVYFFQIQCIQFLSAGAVDEESFIRSFEDCPNVQIFSCREVIENLKTIQDIISDANKDWNKRVEAVSSFTLHCVFSINVNNVDNGSYVIVFVFYSWKKSGHWSLPVLHNMKSSSSV